LSTDFELPRLILSIICTLWTGSDFFLVRYPLRWASVLHPLTKFQLARLIRSAVGTFQVRSAFPNISLYQNLVRTSVCSRISHQISIYRLMQSVIHDAYLSYRAPKFSRVSVCSVRLSNMNPIWSILVWPQGLKLKLSISPPQNPLNRFVSNEHHIASWSCRLYS
jgi:hypothetical protein